MKIYLVCGIDHESYENVEFSFHRNFHLAKEQALQNIKDNIIASGNVSEGNIYNADAVGAYNILRKYCDEHGIKKTFSIKGLTSVKVFKIKR